VSTPFRGRLPARFADAGESAKDTTLVAFGIETQRLGGGFKAAGVSAEVVDLIGEVRRLGDFFS